MKIKATRNVVIEGKVLEAGKSADVSARTGRYLVAIGKAEAIKKAEADSGGDAGGGKGGKAGKKAE